MGKKAKKRAKKKKFEAELAEFDGCHRCLNISKKIEKFRKRIKNEKRKITEFNIEVHSGEFVRKMQKKEEKTGRSINVGPDAFFAGFRRTIRMYEYEIELLEKQLEEAWREHRHRTRKWWEIWK